jgi:large subunit ribosomal protein L15
MENYSLKKPSSIKKRKRVGRGMSSGCGKTSSRGMNGQKSRSGATYRAWFEGGQMPIQRRVPKRGFNNIFKTTYQLVNVSQLAKIKESEITPEILVSKGIIKEATDPVKLLANGDITKAVTITVDGYSKSAKEKIEKAGGTVKLRG